MLHIALGNIEQAQKFGGDSVKHADQFGDLFWQVGTRIAFADSLHQGGDVTAALYWFDEAERLQCEYQPIYPKLFSLRGFYYCNLLLALEDTAVVLERAAYNLKCSTNSGESSLLSLSLPKLTFGHAFLQQQKFIQAADWLNQALTDLRAAGYQQMLPHGLLARATLYRHTHNFPLAHQDLQEVFDIAEPSGMRLHLTDYHLEMARLLLAESIAPSPLAGEGRDGGNSAATQHITAAADLITATGYHRRDAELAELQKSLT